MEIKTYKLSKNTRPHEEIVTASTLDELTKEWPHGIYTTFNTLGGGTKVLGLRAHFKRLYLPINELGVIPAADPAQLREVFSYLANENAPGETKIRVVLSKSDGSIFIAAHLFTPLPEITYEIGVHVVTASLTRHDPQIKDSSFISESSSQRSLVNKDVFEVLLTKNNKIYEGMTSNFYAVSNRRIITARYGILPGVTRKNVMDLAKKMSIPVDYHYPVLGMKFDEAFLTSSSRGIVPIISIDNTIVGEGKVGPLTETLMKAYKVYIFDQSEYIKR